MHAARSRTVPAAQPRVRICWSTAESESAIIMRPVVIDLPKSGTRLNAVELCTKVGIDRRLDHLRPRRHIPSQLTEPFIQQSGDGISSST